MKNIAAVVLGSMSLVACGGGSDAGPPPINVTVTPSTATMSGVVGVYPDGMGVTLTAVLGSVPNGTVYPVIQSTSPAIQTGLAGAVTTASNTYAVDIHTVSTLSVGTYTGTLSLLLCKDPQCASQYPLIGASVPFSVQVIALPKVSLTTMSASGAPTTVAVSPSTPISLPTGTQFSLTSDTPMTWTESDDAASIQGEAITSTSVSGIVVRDPDFSGGLVQLTGVPMASPDYSMRFILAPQPH